MRAALFAAVAVLLAAPAARADTHYGGAGVFEGRPAAPYTSMVRKDDGRIVMRVVIVYKCRKAPSIEVVARLTGTTPDGTSFTAAGRTRAQHRVLRFTASGTLTADAVSGTVRLAGCGGFKRPLALRAASAPAGPAALPAAGTTFNGLSAQVAAGVRLPVTLRVAKSGRVYGTWTSTMKCGKAVIPAGSSMPPTKIKPDGSFLDDKPYTVRYVDGSSDRFRIRFEGRFLADGVVGTLRSRMQRHKKGHRYVACDSGTQTWSARS
jgi:hypothetical protein